MFKHAFISLFLLSVSPAASALSFENLGIADGDYQWLRLNARGNDFDLGCFKNKARAIKELSSREKDPSTPSGSFEIKQDLMVSSRSFNGCTLREEIRLIGIDGKIAQLKLENISSSGCNSIEDLRKVNIERPYDDENLTFISSNFKFVEVTALDGGIEFKRDAGQCFYAAASKNK